MLYTLKKDPLPEDLSIPIQIQSLQEKTIEVIDYDYIGDGLCHLSQCPAERQVPVLHIKASDTRRLGISQTVSQRKARGRHTDTQKNPAIPR